MFEIYFMIFLFGGFSFLFSNILFNLNINKDISKLKNIKLKYSKYFKILSLLIINSSIISILIEFFTFKFDHYKYYIIFGVINLLLGISCSLILFLLLVSFIILILIAHINKINTKIKN